MYTNLKNMNFNIVIIQLSFNQLINNLDYIINIPNGCNNLLYIISLISYKYYF